MWLIFNLKKEFDKIKNSFKERDIKILNLEENINNLKKEIVCRKEIELMISDYLVQFGMKPNQTPYERVMLKRAIKTRPEALKQAIRVCLDKDMKTTEIFKLIVEEKKIISKTQFYHYLSLVRNELQTEPNTILKLKQ